jgi:NAD+ synthase
MIPELEIDCERESSRIAALISDSVSRRRADGVILGLSGGIDSALVAALAAHSLGPARVHAVALPERDSSPESETDARELATVLRIDYRVEEITGALGALGCYRSAASQVARVRDLVRGAVRMLPGVTRKSFLAQLGAEGGLRFREFVAFYRMKHRVRLVTLCREAESKNLLVMSCANRSESETGFFVRYGDDSGDVAPIRHLFKTQVFRLGEWLDLPASILKKRPMPDLFGNVGDEDIIGMSYAELDAILALLDAGLAEDAIAARTGLKPESIRFVEDIKAASQAFRDPPASLM